MLLKGLGAGKYRLTSTELVPIETASGGLLMPTASAGCVNVPGSVDTSDMLKQVKPAAESVNNLLEIHSKLNKTCPQLTWDLTVGTNYLTRTVTKQKRSTHGRVKDIIVEDSTPISTKQKIGLIPTTYAPGAPQSLGSIGKLLTVTSAHSLQKIAATYFTLGKDATSEFHNDLNVYTHVTEENHISMFMYLLRQLFLAQLHTVHVNKKLATQVAHWKSARVGRSRPTIMMADSFVYTPDGVACAPCTYKGLKTALQGKHVIKTSNLTPKLLHLLAGYNAEKDIHIPGDDFVIGACYELHHDVEVAVMAIGPIEDPTAQHFQIGATPPTQEEVWDIIQAIATDNQCFDQLSLAIDMYLALLQSTTADIQFTVGTQNYSGQQMAFGFAGCAVPIPQLSTNPWWVVRLLDSAPCKESVDASSRARNKVSEFFDAIRQIPYGLMALADTLQRIAKVAETHVACTWSLSWRDWLAAWGKYNERRVITAKFFSKHGDEYTCAYGHKLIDIMKHVFGFNSTHYTFPRDNQRKLCYKQEFVDALLVEKDSGMLSYYPWELLDITKATYRSTGTSLDSPPTIIIKDTVTLDKNGVPEWWTMGNVIGEKTLHAMITAGHTNEISVVIAEVSLMCHLLVHL